MALHSDGLFVIPKERRTQFDADENAGTVKRIGSNVTEPQRNVLNCSLWAVGGCVLRERVSMTY